MPSKPSKPSKPPTRAKKQQKPSFSDDEALDIITPQLRSLAVPIDSVFPDKDNPRLHPEANLRAIVASIREKGMDQPIVVRKEDRTIVKGHGRWLAMKELGATKIAAIVIDESRLSAIERGLADNRASDLAGTDDAILARLLAEVSDNGGIIIGWTPDEVMLALIDDTKRAADEALTATSIRGSAPILGSPANPGEIPTENSKSPEGIIDSTEHLTVLKLTVSRAKASFIMKTLQSVKAEFELNTIGDALNHVLEAR